MAFTRQQYSADHFSGANISVSIGPSLLTQAAAIEYNLSNHKQQIYGYNSQYFDAVTKGIVMVQGALYVNFVSPRYLTVTLQRFHQTMRAFQRASHRAAIDPVGVGETLGEFLGASPVAMDVFRAMQGFVDIPASVVPEQAQGELTNDAPFTYSLEGVGEGVFPTGAFAEGRGQPDFGTLLEELFEDEHAISGLSRLYWGDGSRVLINDVQGGTGSQVNSRPNDMLRQWNSASLASSVNVFSRVSSYARPDQMDHPVDGFSGTDINILYGNPFEGSVTDTTFQYDHSASRVIRDVHFIGENTTIMSDGNPILDVYPFFARTVHTIAPPAETIDRSRG